MAREATPTGLVGLWPADVEVAPASGAVVRPLAQERLAPRQVVTRAGWGPADDLLAAATWFARSVTGLSAPASSHGLAHRKP